MEKENAVLRIRCFFDHPLYSFLAPPYSLIGISERNYQERAQLRLQLFFYIMQVLAKAQWIWNLLPMAE
jgi:hypothetical protein